MFTPCLGTPRWLPMVRIVGDDVRAVRVSIHSKGVVDGGAATCTGIESIGAGCCLDVGSAAADRLHLDRREGPGLDAAAGDADQPAGGSDHGHLDPTDRSLQHQYGATGRTAD